jgi:serine/threonine-protein kinase HipA
MDRVFRQVNTLPAQITAMDRLSFVGEGAMGALSYLPLSELKNNTIEEQLSIAKLGLQAQAIFHEVVEAVQSFTRIANKLTINPEVRRLINKQLNNTFLENKILLQKK